MTLARISGGACVFALLAACAPPPSGDSRPADLPPRPSIAVTRAWPAMGTMFVATAWGAPRDSALLLSLLRDARDSIRLVDSLMSGYSGASEISAINRAAGEPMAVAVSPQTLAVLAIARRYWRISGGAFDPTVGPLVAAWGFHGNAGRVPDARELDSLRALIGFAAVEIDSAMGTVRLPRPGMQLDLGGVAKGYALDLARAALGNAAVRAGMLDLGGNVLVVGRAPGTSDGRWRIGIVHPRDASRTIGSIALDSGAVATSGDYERYYVIDGERYSHIIHPATGRPTSSGEGSVISATAIGPRGEWSDGLSATLLLLGPERGIALADSLAGVGVVYVVQGADSAVTTVDVQTSARAAARFTPAASLTVLPGSARTPAPALCAAACPPMQRSVPSAP